MHDPLFSVCIPTFNRLELLKRSLASAEAAVHFLGEHCEILVSDNCSTDLTFEWLTLQKPISPFVELITSKNERNLGFIGNVQSLIGRAKGRYIFWLTDDDQLFPDALWEIKQFMEKNSLEYAHCGLITYLIEQKRSVTHGLKADKFTSSGSIESFLQIHKYSHVLSGTCHRNDLGLRQIINSQPSLYPCAQMCSYFWKSAGFFHQPLCLHLWENELFWEVKQNDPRLVADFQNSVLVCQDFPTDAGTRQLVGAHFLKRDGTLTPEIKKFSGRMPAFRALYSLLTYLTSIRLRNALALLLRRLRQLNSN